jgi:O-antigen ligase
VSVAGRIRNWATARHLAQLAVVALLLACLRIPTEYLRLDGAVPADKLMQAEIIAALFCLVAVLLHFFGRNRSAIALAAVGVVILVVFKFWQLPELS